MWKTVLVCLILPFTAALAAGPDWPGASIVLMEGLQKQLLRKELLIPLGIFSDAELGDTLDMDGNRIIARGSDCFKGLLVERRPHDEIAEHSGSGLNISAALGLAGVADASVGAGRIKTYDLSFKDVQTAYVTLIQLRHARNGDEPECRSLEPFLVGDHIAKVGERMPVIVGKLLYARRSIRIEFNDTASAAVETSGMLARLGGLLTLRATARAAQSNVVELVAAQPSPVAFQPAFVEVERTVGVQMGLGPRHSTVERHWEEFDPELPSHEAAWNLWLDSLP